LAVAKTTAPSTLAATESVMPGRCTITASGTDRADVTLVEHVEGIAVAGGDAAEQPGVGVGLGQQRGCRLLASV
jgi:hypothetical protein